MHDWQSGMGTCLHRLAERHVYTDIVVDMYVYAHVPLTQAGGCVDLRMTYSHTSVLVDGHLMIYVNVMCLWGDICRNKLKPLLQLRPLRVWCARGDARMGELPCAPPPSSASGALVRLAFRARAALALPCPLLGGRH